MKDSFILSHKAFEVKQGRNMEYKLIKSKRKTVELTIDDELCPVIKAPLNMPQRDIDAFFEKHRRWVQKHTEAKRIRMEKKRGFSGGGACRKAKRSAVSRRTHGIFRGAYGAEAYGN